MVNKKIVLNVCGVKSLGGLKLFLESFDFLVESGNKITVLYSELPFYKDLQNQFIDSGLVNFIYIKQTKLFFWIFYILIYFFIQFKLKNLVTRQNILDKVL